MAHSRGQPSSHCGRSPPAATIVEYPSSMGFRVSVTAARCRHRRLDL